jgi:hypothetical protein
MDKDGNKSGLFKDTKIDIIIGSDLIWQPVMVPHLVNCINKVFLENPGVVFYHCYMERSFKLNLDLLKAYRDNGYLMEPLGLDITAKLEEKYAHFPHI